MITNAHIIVKAQWLSMVELATCNESLQLSSLNFNVSNWKNEITIHNQTNINDVASSNVSFLVFNGIGINDKLLFVF